MINIVDYGASPLNTDNAQAIQSAINYASSIDDAVFIPVGIFKHSGIYLNNGSFLTGFNRLSILEYTGTGSGIVCNSIEQFNTEKLTIKNQATVSWTYAYPTVTDVGVGLFVSNCKNFIVQEIGLSNCGRGIKYEASNANKRGIFSNIFGELNYKGIECVNTGEYAVFDKVLLNKNTFGFWVESGNNMFSNCQSTESGVGVKLNGNGISNNGHGHFVGCTFNHNNYALDAYEAVSLGETFNGCNFIGAITNYGNAGLIRFQNSKGIIINGGQIGCNIIANGGAQTQNGANMICNALIRADLSNYTAPSILNNATLLLKNNIDFNGLWSENN